MAGNASGENGNVLKHKSATAFNSDIALPSVNVSTQRQISANYPDIVDPSQTIFQAGNFDESRRMRERHSSSSSGHVQAEERRTSSSPSHNDTSRNSPEQSGTTPSDQRRSESPAIDYRTIDNRNHHSRSSPTHPVTTDISGSRHIQTQDLNAGVVSRMDTRHEALPDILHSHVIPSQVTHVRHSSHRPPGHMIDPRGNHHQSHIRHYPRPHREGHRSHHHRSRRRSRSNSQSDNEPCKDGCFKCLAATTSFRWILVILSLLGVCCVVTGIVLAALHAAGNSFLFLAIMFIGLGVLLVVVVAVGWKCTPRGHEPLHALFSLGDFRRQRGTQRHHRHGHRSREGHWYGGVMYPEFQYRRPPPSYNASMQDYQTQLALAQSQRDFYNDDDIPAEDYSLPSSPPPSYRSRSSTVRTGIQITFPPLQGDEYPNSRPPTYRSHISTSRSQAHPRPSLPRDEDLGNGEAQLGDVAFDGPESVSNVGTVNAHQHSRNNSSVDVVNSASTGAVTITINNSDSSQQMDANKVQQILHSRQPSGSAINSATNTENSMTEENLEKAVQQTLQTLDNATSATQVSGTASTTQDTENNKDPDDDEYPMETPL